MDQIKEVNEMSTTIVLEVIINLLQHIANNEEPEKVKEALAETQDLLKSQK